MASGRSSENTGTPSVPKFKSHLANGRYVVALRGQVLLRKAGLVDRDSDRWVLPEAAGSGRPQSWLEGAGLYGTCCWSEGSVCGTRVARSEVPILCPVCGPWMEAGLLRDEP